MALLLGHALAVLGAGRFGVMTGAGVLSRVKPGGNVSVSVANVTSVEKNAKSVTSNSSPVRAAGGIVLAGRNFGCGAGVWRGMCVSVELHVLLHRQNIAAADELTARHDMQCCCA
jgi:hypothetical protein